jgi:hypothetical protein
MSSKLRHWFLPLGAAAAIALGGSAAAVTAVVDAGSIGPSQSFVDEVNAPALPVQIGNGEIEPGAVRSAIEIGDAPVRSAGTDPKAPVYLADFQEPNKGKGGN